MNRNTALFLVFSVLFPSAVSLGQRLKRSLDLEFESFRALIYSIEIKDAVMEQRLDHFNAFDNRKWSQKYWVTATFYKKSGPAFLFINGQYPVDETRRFGFLRASLLYAEKLNAICFSLEHRFYSKIPPVNGSINHLSSAQALEDIANFIKSMTKDFHLPKNTNWIVFGCSYAGSLAAWSKAKFGGLILGAIVSSAALLAKVDYYEYDQIVEESLESYDPKCVKSITLGFEEIAHLVNSSQNMKNIAQMFYLDLDDDLFNHPDNVKKYLIHTVIHIFSTAVQDHDTSHINIPLVCSIMTEHNGTKLEAFAKIRKMKIEFEEDHVNMPSEKSQKGQNYVYLKLWMYQRCSEFGRFSSYTNVTFLSPVKHLLIPIEVEIETVCQSFFGPKFNVKSLHENVDRTNLQYGGLQYNSGNTLFLYGTLDPWYPSGLYKKSNNSLYEAIFIKGTSHCADVYSPSDKDIPELRNARNKVFKTISRWLKKNTYTL